MATKKTVAPAKAKNAAPVAKTGVAKKSATAKKSSDFEAIRKKAEEIYHARIARGEHGTADGDWLLAEQSLKKGGKKK